MAFSLWDFLLSSLLSINAVAILNEDRFMSRIGWGRAQVDPSVPTVKRQLIELLAAVRFLRIPLIIVNVIAVIFLLILG